MIYAIDNQMRQEWERSGKRPVDLNLHPKTYEKEIKPYCIGYTGHDGRCMSMRWGGLYVLLDSDVGEGLALLNFVRKSRSTRPEDV